MAGLPGLAVACSLMVLSGWIGPAAASVLYRCTGPQGEQAYVSHTQGYTDCVKVGAWPKPQVHAVKVSQTERKPPAAKTFPGKPPREVKANPSIVKVIPLDQHGSIQIRKLTRKRVWQPFPVAVLDALGTQVLPVALGLVTPRVSSPPLAPQPSAAPAATTMIPLRLDLAEVAEPKPPRTGAVYRVKRKDGTVLYTNVASLAKGNKATRLFTYIVQCYACDVHSKVDWHSVPLKLAAYRRDIRAAAQMSGVNAALLRAVIHAESGFNPRALSHKGAQGLMQLMPATAFELGVGDPFDPGENISGGARYLAGLLRDYHGDVKLAAAAYNAGESAVTKYGGVPPYAETQVYVKRVAVLYQRYRKALAGSTTLAATDG